MIRKGRAGSERQIVMYQCAIFYSKKAADELGVKKRGTIKELGESRFTYPYYSDAIFYSDKDALRYIPTFVKDLITRGFMSEDVLVGDKLDQSKAEAAIVPLHPSTLEDFAG